MKPPLALGPVRVSTLIAALAWLPLGALALPLTSESFAGRDAVLYLPAAMPAFGSRALVVVLHGGLGNAQRIAQSQSEGSLNMSAVAKEGGFLTCCAPRFSALPP